MPTLTISGPAQAFAGNPRNSEPITDRNILARFHGLVSAQACADIFDEPPLTDLGLTGGRLRFVLDDTGALRITTTFQVPRPLSEEETQRLLEATTTQWSDGCGSGSFKNFHGTVLSTALAMALLNSGESTDAIGDYFVDAYPLFADEEPRVEFSPTDTEKSDLDFLQEAAALGEPQAQFRLARLLATGDGIEQDDRRAFDHYQRAADQGHLFALTFLGLCLQRGTGTAQDLARGVACFTRAAEAGVPLAMHCLGECLLEGRGIQANPSAGIEWYRRGVELGDLGCTAQLADCYEYGTGVPQDLRQALALYERCLEVGFDAVEEAAQRVRNQLSASGG